MMCEASCSVVLSVYQTSIVFHHLFTQIFREGFKNSTWWEDEYDTEASHEWRI